MLWYNIRKHAFVHEISREGCIFHQRSGTIWGTNKGFCSYSDEDFKKFRITESVACSKFCWKSAEKSLKFLFKRIGKMWLNLMWFLNRIWINLTIHSPRSLSQDIQTLQIMNTPLKIELILVTSVQKFCVLFCSIFFRYI